MATRVITDVTWKAHDYSSVPDLNPFPPPRAETGLIVKVELSSRE